jgi:foldase protein PrsA
MIKFFREKAHIIGWGIVIFFGATMFSGTLFMGGFSGGKNAKTSKRQQEMKNAVAGIGNVPINSFFLNQAININMNQLRNQTSDTFISPELIEMIQYNSFIQAINNTIFLEGARKDGIKISGRELDNQIRNVYFSMGFATKKELRKSLKAQGVIYSDFENSVEELALVKAFVDSIHNSVDVTEEDLSNAFSEVNVKHILINSETNSDANLEVFAQEVYEKIIGGLSFSDAVSQFSSDTTTKEKDGALGWIKYGESIKEFQEVAFSLEKGQISRPVKSDYGYHIIYVLDRREIERPENISDENLRLNLLEQKKDLAINSYLNNYMIDNPLIIKDPSLNAYKSKMEGDLESSVGHYQLILSQNPYAILPHYYIAKIYIALGKKTDALIEFKRADIKANLNPDLDFPELHLALGDLYSNQKMRDKMLGQYEKVFSLVKGNEMRLQQLETILDEKKLFDLKTQVSETIAMLVREREEKEALEALENQTNAAEVINTPENSSQTTEAPN